MSDIPTQPAPIPWQQAPLASWIARVGAYVIDALIIFGLCIIPLIMIGVGIAVRSLVAILILITVGLIAMLVIAIFYGTVLMARPGDANGQTWGKQLVGIRVVRDSGAPYTFGSAFVREFLVKNLLHNTISSSTLGIIVLLDYFWPLFDDEHRALHDMLVNSHVVKVPEYDLHVSGVQAYSPKPQTGPFGKPQYYWQQAGSATTYPPPPPTAGGPDQQPPASPQPLPPSGQPTPPPQPPDDQQQ